MIGPTVDMIWVGRLGAAAIAGVGVSGMAVMMANSIMMGLGMGARAMIARAIGAEDFYGAIHAARPPAALRSRSRCQELATFPSEGRRERQNQARPR